MAKKEKLEGSEEVVLDPKEQARAYIEEAIIKID